MKAQLLKLWESRAPRERAVVGALAALLVAVAYLWLLQSAGQARTRLQASVTVLRGQAARFDQDVAEFGRLRVAPAATASPTSLHALVQASTGDAGLSGALLSIDAPDPDHVVVAFGAVAFTDWLDWITGLKSQHTRLDASRIEALSTPGLVSVTATLVRSKTQ